MDTHENSEPSQPLAVPLEREELGDQCVWLKPVEAEFECLGEPSLCANPRGCACVPDSKTPNVAGNRLAEGKSG